MDDSEATSLEQIQAFLEGTGDVRFAGQCRQEVYAWTERTLLRHRYGALNRKEKGLVRQYVSRMTGLSRAQVTRLIASYAESGRVQPTVYQRRRFASRYTKADIELLAYVDKSHENLSGPATKRILERESVIRLSQKDARKILSLLDSPPKPTRALKDAVKVFKGSVRA